MGKRSNFERRERDFYQTPVEAVLPLLPFIKGVSRFYEPCAGDGALVRHMERFGLDCIRATDIEPQADGIEVADATQDWLLRGSMGIGPFITNPPWRRDVLHPIIENLVQQGTAWLLFDADWMHTKQSADYIGYCTDIVSVGRVKWIPDSKMTGKDNCCWYRFSLVPGEGGLPRFHGRK